MPTDRRLILLVLAAGLALVVVFGKLLAPAGPATDPVSTSPPPALSLPAAGGGDDAGPVLVHVVGAVRRPGVYRLTGGSRVRDALRRAGGARSGAHLQQINLAERLADGEQVVVPGRGVTISAPAAGAPGAVVHLASATAEQLAALDGIGPALAERIMPTASSTAAFAASTSSRDVARDRPCQARGPAWTRRPVSSPSRRSCRRSPPVSPYRPRCAAAPSAGSPYRARACRCARSDVAGGRAAGRGHGHGRGRGGGRLVAPPARAARPGPARAARRAGRRRPGRRRRTAASRPLRHEGGRRYRRRRRGAGPVPAGRDRGRPRCPRPARAPQRVRATGSTSAPGSRIRASTSCCASSGRRRSAGAAACSAWSTRIARRARDALAAGGDGEPAKVAQGLLLGGSGELAPDTQEDFRASGLQHVLAVSGSNVALLAGIVLATAWLVGLSRAVAHAIVIPTLIAYALVVGPGASVVRASVAGVAVSTAWLVNRPVLRWHVLALGAAIVLASTRGPSSSRASSSRSSRWRRSTARAAALRVARRTAVPGGAARADRRLGGLHRSRRRRSRGGTSTARRGRERAGEPARPAAGRAGAVDGRSSRCSRTRSRPASRSRSTSRSTAWPARSSGSPSSAPGSTRAGRSCSRWSAAADPGPAHPPPARPDRARPRRPGAGRGLRAAPGRRPGAGAAQVAPRHLPRRRPGERHADRGAGLIVLDDAGAAGGRRRAPATSARRATARPARPVPPTVGPRRRRGRRARRRPRRASARPWTAEQRGRSSSRRWRTARRRGVPVTIARSGLRCGRGRSSCGCSGRSTSSPGEDPNRRGDRARGEPGRVPLPATRRRGVRRARAPLALPQATRARGRAPRLGGSGTRGAAAARAAARGGHLGRRGQQLRPPGGGDARDPGAGGRACPADRPRGRRQPDVPVGPA